MTARERFAPHLVAGETVLWTGQPDPWRLLHRYDLLFIPFGLLWTALVVAFMGAEARSDRSLIIPFLLFLVAGLYVSVGRLLYLYIAKKRTRYAVTNRRVLVLGHWVTDAGTWRDGPLTAVPIDSYLSVTHTIRPDGCGTLGFGDPLDPVVLFSDIADAAQVYTLVTSLRDQAASAARQAATAVAVFELDSKSGRAVPACMFLLIGSLMALFSGLGWAGLLEGNAEDAGNPWMLLGVAMGLFFAYLGWWSLTKDPYEVRLTDADTLVCRQPIGTKSIPVRDILALERSWTGEDDETRALKVVHSKGRVSIQGWTFDQAERFIAALTEQKPAILVVGEW